MPLRLRLSFETISNFFVNMPGPSFDRVLSIMAIMLLGAAASASGMIIAAMAAASTFYSVLGVNATKCIPPCAGYVHHGARFPALCRRHCGNDEHHRHQVTRRAILPSP